MPAGENVTTKFKVDISDLKSNITQANKLIKLANAEFKAASAGMDDWSKSATGIQAKLKQLASVLDAQKSKLSSYEQQLDRQKEAYDENGKRADQLKAKLQELANNGVKETSDEYKKYQTELAAVEKEQTSNEKAIDNLKVTILNQQAAVKSTEAEIRKYDEALNQLESESKEATQESKKLKDAVDDVDDNAKKASDGFSVLKGALANLVAEGFRRAIDAAKNFVKEIVTVGQEFDSAMSKVGAVSGATGDELEMLREKAKEMGASTKFTASEAAEAFNYMAMAGWKTEDMLNGIEGILSLAAASGSDLATTSDIVTDALTAMGYSAADAGRLADVMAAASSNANTNVEMMGATFQYAAPIVGALGYNMEDTAVAIGLMANAGIKGQKAGTALRSIMTRLSTDAGASSKSLGALGILTEKLGVEFYNLDGTTRPLNKVLNEARAAWQGLSAEQQTSYGKIIAGQEAMSGWLAIMNAAPADIKKLTTAVQDSDGAAAKMAETMQDNLGGDMTRLSSQFEGLQIMIYEKFEPALRSGVELLSKFGNAIAWLVDHSSQISAFFKVLIAGVASYVAYTTAIKVMTFGWKSLVIVQKAVAAAQWLMNAAMAANPIGLIVAAIAALITAFVLLWKNSEGFREFWINLWDGIKRTASNVADWFSKKWTELRETLEKIPEWFSNAFGKAWTKITEKFKSWGAFWSNLWNIIKNKFTNIGTNIGNAISGSIKSGINRLFGWVENTINRIISLINGAISMINKIPGVGIGYVNYVNLPRLETGGVIKKPTTVLAGENGPEAIIPLKNNREWIRSVAAELGNILGFGSGGVVNNSVSNTATTNFTQNIYAPQAPSRLELYRQTKNLLSLAKSVKGA